MEMTAAVFEGEGKLALRRAPVPALSRPDQILIRVEAASICGTDVHITSIPARYPATPGTILGHEFVGIVKQAGRDVLHLAPGDRVVVDPNDSCGCCPYCRKNLSNHCERIQALGIDYPGAFAQYVVTSGRVAHRIARGVPAAQAACAEPLACALSGLRKAAARPGDSAVVVGGGPIGLMLAMLLRRSGVGKPYLLEISAYRRAIAQKLGFTAINPAAEDARKRIAQDTRIGADIVYDVTGSQMPECVDYARRGGTVVLFGVNKQASREVKQCEITTKELSVQGTWLANSTFPEAVKILEEGSIDVGALITETLPLSRVQEGLQKLARGEAVKVIITP